MSFIIPPNGANADVFISINTYPIIKIKLISPLNLLNKHSKIVRIKNKQKIDANSKKKKQKHYYIH